MMKLYINVILMTVICIVGFMVIKPVSAHAQWTAEELKKNDAAPAASGRELLFVVLLDKAGERSAHYQLVNEHSDCVLLLTKFRETAQRGLPVVFTFLAPPQVTGNVLAAACIAPEILSPAHAGLFSARLPTSRERKKPL